MSEDIIELINPISTKHHNAKHAERVNMMHVAPCKEVEALKAMLFNEHAQRERIEYIKGELSAGRYQTSQEVIAEKIMGDF